MGLKNVQTFLKPSIQERSKMIFKKKLCYGCNQKDSRTHNVKSCTNRKVCKASSGKHPITLNGLVLKRGNSEKKSEKQVVEETSENQNLSWNH